MRKDGNAPTTGADAFIETLTQPGIDTVYAKMGTDFPPIGEALSKSADMGRRIQAIAVPHENVAVSMATVVPSCPANRRSQAAYQCRRCERRLCADECVSRIHSADRHRWPHDLYRERASCRATSSFTGCRDFQPGRPRARNRQMGFRDQDSEGEPKGRVYLTLPREMLATETEMQDMAPLMPATQRIKVDPACNRRGGADFRAGATASHHHREFGSEAQDGDGADFANDALDIPAVPIFRSRSAHPPTTPCTWLMHRPIWSAMRIRSRCWNAMSCGSRFQQIRGTEQAWRPSCAGNSNEMRLR